MRSLLAFALALLLSSTLGAQDTASVAAGARLRVMAGMMAGWRYGTFAGVERDSLVLRSSAGDARYPLNDLRAVEVYQRRPGLRSHHAAIGVGAGAIAGILGLIVSVQHCERTTAAMDGPPCALGYTGLPLVATAGGVAGGVLGALWPVRHWRRATLSGAAPAH